MNGCVKCLDLGGAHDENGAPCQLFWCTCIAREPYVCVEGAMGCRAVPLHVLRCGPAGDARTPQAEGFRRAVNRGLVER